MPEAIRVATNEATAARRRAYFYCVDATDGITPETSEASGQPQISVDGAAYTNTGIGTLTAAGNGDYYADVTQATVNVANAVIRTRYKSSATAESRGSVLVVSANWDRIDATLSGLETKIDTVDGVADAILVDTAVIGALGAGLTAVPWNAAWDAEVQSECTDALNAYDPPTNTEMLAAHDYQWVDYDGRYGGRFNSGGHRLCGEVDSGQVYNYHQQRHPYQRSLRHRRHYSTSYLGLHSCHRDKGQGDVMIFDPQKVAFWGWSEDGEDLAQAIAFWGWGAEGIFTDVRIWWQA